MILYMVRDGATENLEAFGPKAMAGCLTGSSRLGTLWLAGWPAGCIKPSRAVRAARPLLPAALPALFLRLLRALRAALFVDMVVNRMQSVRTVRSLERVRGLVLGSSCPVVAQLFYERNHSRISHIVNFVMRSFTAFPSISKMPSLCETEYSLCLLFPGQAMAE